MMCPPSDSDRDPRTYYGYGANTLWFQYILCQQESIPSLACWLFTSGWNQAEFGQYYLYDNLLNSEEGGLLDGDLLPILALSGGGGLGFGGNSYAPAHGGHPVYRRSTCEDDEEMTAEGCRKRRSVCEDGEDKTPEGCRKRRSSECEYDEVKTSEGCRKRRETPECKDDEVKAPSGCRKRRSSECKDGEDKTPEGCRKRRSSECESDEVVTSEGCRKRRETPKCKDDEVKAPSGCRKRRSSSVTTCEDGVGVVGVDC